MFTFSKFSKTILLQGVLMVWVSLQTFAQQVTYYTTSTSWLYEDSGNQIIVKGLKKPSYQVQNATLILGKSPEEIVIIPNTGATEVELTVFSKNKMVEKKKFSVKPVPLARAALYDGDKEVNLQDFELAKINDLKLVIQPDPVFKNFQTKDADYKSNKVSVKLKREGKTIAEQTDFNGLLSQAQKGDLFVVEIEDVVRTNVRGEVIPAKVSNPITVFPIQ